MNILSKFSKKILKRSSVSKFGIKKISRERQNYRCEKIIFANENKEF